MSLLSQAFPPPPGFTEEDLPDQTGRVSIASPAGKYDYLKANKTQVVIVTGAAVGVGYQLAKILYEKNATVYIATRSKAKIDNAIATLKQEVPFSRGRVESMLLDLSDLTSIKPAAERFLAQESRLDVVVHNAAVMRPPKGSKSVQVTNQRSRTDT